MYILVLGVLCLIGIYYLLRSSKKKEVLEKVEEVKGEIKVAKLQQQVETLKNDLKSEETKIEEIKNV